MVQALLRRGANPLLANDQRLAPMNQAAGHGDTGMVDMILSAAPAALNLGTGKQGTTAMGITVDSRVLSPHDKKRTVRHLLSLGATDRDVPENVASTLVGAVRRGDNVSSYFLLPPLRNSTWYACLCATALHEIVISPYSCPALLHTPRGKSKSKASVSMANPALMLPCVFACFAEHGTPTAGRSAARGGRFLGCRRGLFGHYRGSRERACQDPRDAHHRRGRRTATTLDESARERRAGRFSARLRAALPRRPASFSRPARTSRTSTTRATCAIEYAATRLPAENINADNSKTSAVRRTLESAPAFRARSWAWSAAVISSFIAGCAGASVTAGGGAS